MKKNIIIIMIVAFFFCAPLPREYATCDNVEHSDFCKVHRTLKMAIIPFRKKESIVNRLSLFRVVIEEIKPVLLEEYKHVVVKPKFRPQSARIMVEESFQNLYLQKQNICSIIRTRNFVSC